MKKLIMTAMLMSLILTGCVLPTERGNVKEAGPDNKNHFDTVTLRPGDSAICIQSPCSVYFVMPEGTGSYVVSGMDVYPESYPAGETAFIGSFWTGSYSMHAEGTETPYAYLTVAGGGDYDGADMK